MRKFRAAIGNAAFWGAAWFVGTLAMSVVFRLVFPREGPEPWWPILAFSLRASVVGALASTIFSAFIAFWYRGRRLAEINWLVFGLGGAVVIGLFIPVFLSVMRALSGDAPLPFSGLLSNATFGAVFGGIAAAASLKFAQVAARYASTTPDEQQSLHEGSAPPSSASHREGVGARRDPEG